MLCQCMGLGSHHQPDRGLGVVHKDCPVGSWYLLVVHMVLGISHGSVRSVHRWQVTRHQKSGC